MTRIQLELSELRVKELESLMELIGIRTKKDLVNNALTFFEWAVKERKAGRVIASILKEEDEYKEIKEITMPVLEHVAPKKEWASSTM